MNCKSSIFFLVLAVCVFVASCVPVIDDAEDDGQGTFKLFYVVSNCSTKVCSKKYLICNCFLNIYTNLACCFISVSLLFVISFLNIYYYLLLKT